MVAAAVISGIVLNAYSASACSSANGEKVQGWFSWKDFGSAGWTNNAMMEKPPMPRGWMRGRGCFGYGFIEVSEEFKENVIKIAEDDSDVQNLLNDGYNITGVKPIIKTVVEGDGTIVTKATTAIVMLEKDTTGRAMVWVDLEQGKVTKIAILTLTIIEKP